MSKKRTNSVLKEVQIRIRLTYWEKKRVKSVKGRLSFGEDLRRLVIRRRREPLVLTPEIQIWLAFFDEVIGFWLLTWGFYRDQLNKPPVPNQLVCLATLSGRVFQDLVCVREMIASGFFVQSNVVARSLIEAIDVMHLIQVEPRLADEFRAVETNDQASAFWHAHCSRNKIHKRILERWNWFFSEKEGHVAARFHAQREDYLDLIGMSAHPSFAASFSSFMDAPAGHEPDSIVYNALGAVSQMSKFTMHLIFLRVFEYGMLWVGPDANIYKPSVGMRTRRFKKQLNRCLNIVFSIVFTVNNDRKPNPFFPEFKTYWPSKSFHEK